MEIEFTLRKTDREPIHARDKPWEPVGPTPRGFESRPRRWIITNL